MDSAWIAGLAALGGSLAGGVGATVGTWWFDLRKEQRAGKAAALVIYRELMHNGQALSTFRKTEGNWLSEPTDRSWVQHGAALAAILAEEEWPFVVAGYSLLGYWKGLPRDDDGTGILDETAHDIQEAAVVLAPFVGLSQDELRGRYAASEADRQSGS